MLKQLQTIKLPLTNLITWRQLPRLYGMKAAETWSQTSDGLQQTAQIDNITEYFSQDQAQEAVLADSHLRNLWEQQSAQFELYGIPEIGRYVLVVSQTV
ncbi:hypothetical protein [Companilactobacillus sp.]|uniref:hypothetical protein n=1 Tax=Companilactobacillus sp. TaxID=2767905 RepID=UPI00261508D1|nr:hypothetical protein [Companilactobacillus sp.]